MGVKLRAVSPTEELLRVGQSWVLEVEVKNFDGVLASATVSATVTLPNASTANVAFEAYATGLYRGLYEVAATGRHVATVSGVGDTGDDSVVFAMYALAITAAGGMPNVDNVAAYMGSSAAGWETADLQNALNAEAAAQRATVRVGAVYTDDLREALLRRVQRNLAMRRLPLAVLQGDAEAGAAFLPGRDPEVRRLEAPYRRVVIA